MKKVLQFYIVLRNFQMVFKWKIKKINIPFFLMYKNVKYPSARYYQRNKESIQGGSREKHQNHSEKEKVKKQ